MPKPRPDHPWILRTRQQVAAARLKHQHPRPAREAIALAALREDADAAEREQAEEVGRTIREFFA